MIGKSAHNSLESGLRRGAPGLSLCGRVAAAGRIPARPQLAESAEVFTAQLQADIDETFTSEVTERSGLGYMDPKAWEATVDILADQDVLEGEVNPEDAFDNSFVKGAEGGGMAE